MKTSILLLSALFINHTLSANELAWVNEQVEAIKPPRKAPVISSISNPFVFLEKNGYIKPEPVVVPLKEGQKKSDTSAISSMSGIRSVNNLMLNAIINSSALINDKWYKKNQKVGSFTIIDIGKDYAILKSADKQITLSTETKKQNLKFKNK